ncbi:MAG TPA: inorganic phosphate transporter [Bacteroidia bacterium]|jgi:phosphate/sulfate permease|nr:inorganic phosphate transporter [Bacteroidia bacterium]
MGDISTGILILLIICLVLACAFEFVNGFHDTANAVATVIYTNSLKPTVAVIWSGLWNFIGVIAGGIGVAMGIVNLLPVEVLTDSSVSHGAAMIVALLVTAILWNLGTWYLGLPASSSHTLIGSILGVGLAFYFINGKDAVNWGKAQEIGLALLFSPLFGFAAAIFVMYVFKRLIKNEAIYKEPTPGVPPPLWIRAILTLTCTLVSFFHGSNDGQKGIGLVMLILIVFIPKDYVINPSQDISVTYSQIKIVKETLNRSNAERLTDGELGIYKNTNAILDNLLQITREKKTVSEIDPSLRFELRKGIIIMSKNIDKLIKGKNLLLTLNEIKRIEEYSAKSKSATDYSPNWVPIVISISLGLGTMIGWKRVVQTVGEKIGKQNMSYAQGASAGLVAASTIGLSTGFGLPVSTTHVLSSGIAGTMVAKKGLKNLQKDTIRNILIAWILTLPVTMIISGGLFLLFRWLF